MGGGGTSKSWFYSQIWMILSNAWPLTLEVRDEDGAVSLEALISSIEGRMVDARCGFLP